MRSPLLALLKGVQRFFGGSGLGRIRPLRRLYDGAYRLLKPSRALVQGHWMWLDEKDSLELATREVYEPAETALLLRELKEGQTFVDVGANIGYYTLLAARRVGPGGRVFAFEPDPANFGLLKRNVEANGYPNAVLVEAALSRRSGRARLYLNPLNRGDHRIYDSRDGRERVEIRILSLDAFFKKLDKKIHFIKMDVQGAEAAVLEGMRGLVRANRSLKLVTEFSPGALKAFGSDPRKYLADLQKLGFRIREISEKDGTLKPVDPSRLLSRPWAGADDYTNLFCVKKP